MIVNVSPYNCVVSLRRWHGVHINSGGLAFYFISNKLSITSSRTQHAPGDDQYGYEDAGERWMPVHTVESIVRV